MEVIKQYSVSKFAFIYPAEDGQSSPTTDKDGDLVLTRKKKSVIEIEHHTSTDLTLVGLQVWRGALLLADFIFHNRKFFQNKNILELGSGVGLTGIAAAIYAKNVICTDINLGGILSLIKGNIKRNSSLINNNADVMELDFYADDWSPELKESILSTQIVLAADVIYDDELTDAFIKTLEKLLMPSPNTENQPKIIYIALEKRYVFTVADLESLAPCYEYFLSCIEKIRWNKNWKFESIPIDFPQFFDYGRVKELVLLKLSL